MKRATWIVIGLSLLALSGFVVHETSGGTQAGEKKVEQNTEYRVFEMRTYYASPGKMKALEDRFRNNTNKLFVKHGMTIIGFWKPTDSKEDDTLIYILAYPSRDAAKASWAAFQKDPVWVAAKSASETDGKLVAKVVSVYMKATDYSPIK